MERSRVPLPDEGSELCNSISYQTATQLVSLAIRGRCQLAEGNGSESNEGINLIKDRGGDIGRDRGREG